MLWRVARNNKTIVRLMNALVAGLSSVLLGLLMTGQAGALVGSTGSVIGATICVNSSSITIIQPVSDSVVATPTVNLQGTAQQASQVEIRIDGVFDSTIPMSVGQTAFSGSVQLSSGTHTISLTAINVCSGANDEASVVVTYSPPPETTPSSGSDIPTDVGGGVVNQGVGPGVDAVTNDTPTVIDQFALPLQTIADWLNVGTTDSSKPEIATMHISQAAALTAGLALAVIGVSPVVVSHAITLPAVAALLPFTPTPQRILFISRGGRIIGLLIVLGTLFL